MAKAKKPGKDEPKRPRGRPSDYTPALAARICDRLAKGESLRAICRDEDMPHESAVRVWAINDVGADENGKGGFYSQYARARDIGLDAMADETLEIADKPAIGIKRKLGPTGQVIETMAVDTVDRSRLRVDTRKWYLSKLAPKRYGEKLTHEHSGIDGGAIKTQDVNAADQAILDRYEKRLREQNGIKSDPKK